MAASSDEKIPEINIEDSKSEQKDAQTSETKTEGAAPAQAGRRRQKVPLAPGHTLAHWNELVMTRKRYTPSVKITPKQLAEHKSQNDAWISLNGKVFDVTKYLDYHPGGIPKLMQAAGRDATSLFYKYHSWVNYESLLAADCLGYLVPDEEEA